MNFHWGKGISLFYGLFVAGTLSMVAFYTGQDVDLVSKEYYNEEIKYQDRIEKLKRTSALSEKVEFQALNEKVAVLFPKTIKEDVSGEIFFFRPSDRKYDFRLPLNINSNSVQLVSFHGKRKGLWKIEMNWKAGNKEYLNEEFINIQ